MRPSTLEQQIFINLRQNVSGTNQQCQNVLHQTGRGQKVLLPDSSGQHY